MLTSQQRQRIQTAAKRARQATSAPDARAGGGVELRLDYSPHAKQQAFHAAVREFDYVLFNGGRGSGKTIGGASQAIMEACVHQQGERGVVIAPTYPMLRDASMKEFFTLLPREWIKSWSKSDKELILVNGSEIAFRSADNPDSLRGPNRAWAWFDEPRNLRLRDAFDIAIGQLRPTRKCWLTTTPAGIFHWLYQMFIQTPLPKSAVIHVRTIENPYAGEDYEANLRVQYTGAFAAQELDAEWVSFEGRIYDGFSLDENVTEAADYNPDWPIMWFCDDGYAYGQGPGYSSYHPRVILLAQVTPEGGCNIFAEYVKCNEVAERSIDSVLASGYPIPEAAYVDSSASELKIRIREKGIPTAGATHKVAEGIKNVRRMIEDGNGRRLLKINPRCKDLIREFQTYRYDDKAIVAVAGERPPLKVDDHCVDAARYGVYHLRYGE
jgi:phage terminase large subunit